MGVFGGKEKDRRLIQAGADMTNSDVALLGDLLTEKERTDIRIKNLERLIAQGNLNDPIVDKQREILARLKNLQYFYANQRPTGMIDRIRGRGKQGTKSDKSRNHW